MAPPTLAELLAAVEKRKHDALKLKLGISPDLKINGIELDSLAYHLTERSGAAHLVLVEDQLKVGEPGQSTGLVYSGDAKAFLLKTWGISLEDAQRGITIQVQAGKRIG